jgi:hypothetical protein
VTRWQPPILLIRFGFVVAVAALVPIVYQIVWLDAPSESVIQASFAVVLLGLCPFGWRAIMLSRPVRLHAHVQGDLHRTFRAGTSLRVVPFPTAIEEIERGWAGWIREDQLVRFSTPFSSTGIDPHAIAYPVPTVGRTTLLYYDGAMDTFRAFSFGEGGDPNDWSTADDGMWAVILHGCPALPAELLY